MCNNYANHVPPQDYFEAFRQTRLPLRFAGGRTPNLEPRDDIRSTDRAPVIYALNGGVELDELSWGLKPKAPKGAPVINFRSEGREFPSGRCLVPASWFYEFTGDKYPKTRWRFEKVGEPWFCIAGLMRDRGDSARFTMLTCDPGPDVAAFHDRQVAVLDRAEWAAWLDPRVPAQRLLKTLPAGSFTVTEWPRK